MQSIKTASKFVSGLKKNGEINRVLVTGASGQLGTELYPFLVQLYGKDNVLMTDLKNKSFPENHFKVLDVTDKAATEKLVHNFRPDTIIHNAAILSAAGEKNPDLALKVNNESAKIFIDMCTESKIRLFAPSSIASFGPSTPKIAPNKTIQRPESIYGITKVYLELLGNYYNKKYGLDFRSIRYPVVISPTPAFFGTAACTVEIYYEALRNKKYEMYLKPETTLPIIYIDDVINGTLGLLEAKDSQLTERTYNITSTNFTIGQLVDSVKKAVPGFEVTYKIQDYRQSVADSWPDAIDPAVAKEDFGFEPQFDIEAITKDMIEKLSRAK